jgi:hypothetical protein
VTHFTEGKSRLPQYLRAVCNVPRILNLVLLATLSIAAQSAAHADATARVIETQPGADAVLGRQESFWVRIGYNSDEAITLWARPYRDGVQVKKAISNGSSSYTGSGEALGWFALTEPGDVDEVRIFAGGGKPYREWELARHSVRLSWTNETATANPPEPWVTDLLAIEKAQQAQAAQRRANEPTSVASTAFLSGFMLAVLAMFIASIGAPLWSIWKWQGGWRIAAAVPAALIVFVVLRIIIDTAHDPTSHNLWPFEILEFGIVALVIVGALALARRITAGRT